MPIQAVYKICDSAAPSSIALPSFQWLGLGPYPGLGLGKSPNQTKFKFPFMASLHMFLLRFIHSHTFKSSLLICFSKSTPQGYTSSAQLASARSERSQIISTCWNFLEAKESIVMYQELKYHALPDSSQGK